MEEKSVVKKTEDVPAYLQTKGELGIETIESTDVIISRIKIAQGSSHSAKKANKELKEGEFYNHLTAESFGVKIKFFPLLYWRSRVWFDDEFKMLGTIYRDVETREEIRFGQDIDYCIANPDKAMDSFNFMVILLQDLTKAVKMKQISIPYIFSCSSAAIKWAKQLTSKLKFNGIQKKIPIYSQLIGVESALEEFKAAPAYMPHFSYGRFASEEEAPFLKKMFESCKSIQRRPDINKDTVEDGDAQEIEAVQKAQSEPEPEPKNKEKEQEQILIDPNDDNITLSEEELPF